MQQSLDTTKNVLVTKSGIAVSISEEQENQVLAEISRGRESIKIGAEFIAAPDIRGIYSQEKFNQTKLAEQQRENAPVLRDSFEQYKNVLEPSVKEKRAGVAKLRKMLIEKGVLP